MAHSSVTRCRHTVGEVHAVRSQKGVNVVHLSCRCKDSIAQKGLWWQCSLFVGNVDHISSRQVQRTDHRISSRRKKPAHTGGLIECLFKMCR